MIEGILEVQEIKTSSVKSASVVVFHRKENWLRFVLKIIPPKHLFYHLKLSISGLSSMGN